MHFYLPLWQSESLGNDVAPNSGNQYIRVCHFLNAAIAFDCRGIPLNTPGQDLTETTNSKRAFQISAIFALLFCILIGLFAVKLNTLYYENNQPFYDSLAYHNNMARVMFTGREEGMLAAIEEACIRPTTAAPFLIGALLSPIMEPNRILAVWIQTTELAFLALSIVYYLCCIRKQSSTVSCLAVLPVFAMAGMYRFNGGLSDFRVDLSLCLMFALTAVWYLVAIETRRQSHFLLFGLSAGMACLFRATFSIYFIAAFGPLLVLDLLTSKQRGSMLKGIVKAFLMASAVATWYYALRYKEMYYYYAVWNVDALAKLPLSQSIRHAVFAFKHVGVVAILMAMVLYSALLVQRLKIDRTSLRSFVREFTSGNVAGDQFRTPFGLGWFHYRMLWLAAAPTVLMIARGSGLNPFVCMPSATCFILFMIAPFALMRADFSKRVLWPTSVAMLLLFGIQIHSALKSHGLQEANTMAAHREVLNTAIQDARKRNLESAGISALHFYNMCNGSLKSVARFDIPGAVVTKSECSIDGVRVHFPHATQVAAMIDWEKVPGENDEERRQSIIDRLNQEVNYLVIPTAETMQFLVQRFGHNVINRHCGALKQQLLASKRWKPITGVISNGPVEKVVLYRRVDNDQKPNDPRVTDRSNEVIR